ncbi:MAG: chromosomal replication initiator DnaA [Sulfitobacter sp.]
MATQLGFDLPSRTALGRDAFFVSPSNAVALAMIDAWESWAGGKLVLTGPVGAGKTHLTHVWADLSGATILNARSLETADVPLLAQGHIAVEDVAQIAGDMAAQTTLFHLHNLTLAEGNRILFTGSAPVAGWALELPDLVSRLQGTTLAALEAPDDTLLTAVLAKLFYDRQLTPKADVIPYLLARMDRSFAAALEVVAQLDAASLAQKRAITRHFAASVLDNRPLKA